MDNRKEGLKELGMALAATVIIIAASKFLTNTVLSGVSDALYKTFCGKAAMTVLVFVAVVILKKMKMYKFSFSPVPNSKFTEWSEEYLEYFQSVNGIRLTSDEIRDRMPYTMLYKGEAHYRSMVSVLNHDAYKTEYVDTII